MLVQRRCRRLWRGRCTLGDDGMIMLGRRIGERRVIAKDDSPWFQMETF